MTPRSALPSMAITGPTPAISDRRWGEPCAQPAGQYRRQRLDIDTDQQPPHRSGGGSTAGIRARIARRGVDSSTRLGRHRYVIERCLDQLENFVWHRVLHWWMRLHRWTWNDVRRRLTGPNGRWTRPTADGIELFNIASVPVTRYIYRGIQIPNPWNLANHA